jgi:hypothetical protein
MRIERHSRDHVPGIVIALTAGLHKAILASTPVNDDYQHLAYARQLFHGDLPLRDFWDLSTTLQEAMSAASQLVFGQRLLAEAVVIGVATAVAVYFAYRILQQLTGSTLIAALCAALFIIAVPRAYAYPKWIVYAIAAWLWWNNVWWPSTQKAIAAGLSTAAAFYWRHDHGVLVAVGVALGMIAAHGFSRLAVRRTVIAGAVALACTTPYLVFAAVEVGPVNLVRMEMTALQDERGRSRAPLNWPLRTTSDFLQSEPAEAYAPEMTIRWQANAPADARRAALARYGLTAIEDDGPQAQRVRLSARSIGSLKSVIDDPLVEDTAGVERGPAAFSWSQWKPWDRARFHVPWLRFTVLPGLDQQILAGAAAAMILHAMPLLAALLAGPTLRRLLPPALTPRPLLLFAAFAVVVNFGLLREPYESRAADVVVLPLILFGVFLSILLRPTYPAVVKWSLRVAAVLLMVLAAKSFAVAGDFGDRIAWLIGEGRSLERAQGAWSEIGARLRASPPSEFWPGNAGPVPLRLAKYVRRCTAPSDRVLVLWFAPEIHADADRLMAGRHLYYFEAFRGIDEEQRRELEKVTRSAPRIVLANRNNYQAAVTTFPAVMRHIESEYVPAASFDEDGDRYTILIRRESPPPSLDSVTGWPCFTGGRVTTE